MESVLEQSLVYKQKCGAKYKVEQEILAKPKVPNKPEQSRVCQVRGK